MRLARVILVAIAVLFASFVVPLPESRGAAGAVLALALAPHAPIDIDGNAAFTAANGVIGGQGTVADPYIISDWSIDSPPAIGVQVRNTNAHAVFLNISVTNAPVDAFYFYSASNITVANATAYLNAGEGIRFESSHGFSVLASNFTGNRAGVVMLNSADAVVRGSNFSTNAADGILVTGSPNVTLQGNRFAYNGFSGVGYGIDLAFTTDDAVLANRFTANGVYLAGDSLSYFDSHTITPDNLVAGLPILYQKDCNGLGLSGMDLGQILLAGCHHARLSNLTVAGGDVGIEIAFGTDAIIGPGVLVAESSTGISIMQTSSVQVVGSQILDTAFGVVVDTSTGVRISGTKISSPFSATGPFDGVVIRASDTVNISSNIIRHRRYAIAVSGSGNVSLGDNVVGFSVLGVDASSSHDLQVVGNLITQDTAGMRLQNVTNATFTGNALLSILTTGVNVSASSGLTFAHNAFGSSSVNAYDAQGTRDTWDGGYPAGGNFWTNYVGTDQFHGAGQNLSGSDGIGDTPYLFDVNAVDRYPLMVPPVRADVMPEALFLVAPAVGTPLVPFSVTAAISSDLEDSLSVLQVRWSWDDNASVTPWTTTKSATHVYGTLGVHSIRLEVKDSAGLTDSWTAQVLVLPKPDGLPPQILSTSPVSADVGQPIPITANITDPSGIANATLLYRGVDGGPFQSIPMQVENNGTNFTATIPAQPHTGTVEYVIAANDTWANEARAPLAGVESIPVIDPVMTLLLNVLAPALVAGAVVAIAFLVYRWRKRLGPGPAPPPGSPPPQSP